MSTSGGDKNPTFSFCCDGAFTKKYTGMEIGNPEKEERVQENKKKPGAPSYQMW